MVAGKRVSGGTVTPGGLADKFNRGWRKAEESRGIVNGVLVRFREEPKETHQRRGSWCEVGPP